MVDLLKPLEKKPSAAVDLLKPLTRNQEYDPFGQTDPNPPPPEEVTASNVVGEVVRGVNRAATQFAGMPADMLKGIADYSFRQPDVGDGPGVIPRPEQVLGMALRKMGYSPDFDPIGGEENLKWMLEKAGVDNSPKSNSALARIAGRMAEEVGGTIVPAGAGLRSANKAMKAGREVGPIAKSLIERPGMQAASTVAAGTAAGVAKEVAPDSPWIEMGAAVLGGLGPDIGRSAYIGLKNPTVGVVEPFTQSGRERIVGGTLRESAGNPAVAAEEMRGAGEIVPGSQPTAPQASGDPGLLNLERTLRNEQNMIPALTGRSADQNAARRAALDTVEPGSEGATRLASIIETKLAEFTGATDEIISRAALRASERIHLLGPGVDPEVAGNIIREEYNAVRSSRKAMEKTAYNAIDPDNTTSIHVQEAYVKSAQDLSKYSGRRPDSALVDELDQLRAEYMSFEDMKAMRSRLGGIQNKAAQAGDNNTAAAAGAMRDHLEEAMEKAATSGDGMTQQQVAQYREATRLRRSRGQDMDQGANKPMARNKAFGEVAKTDSEVPALYFNTSGGSLEDAEAFVTAVGSRARAVDALQGHVISRIRAEATDVNGNVNPALWRRFMQNHAQALKPFPELWNRLGSVHSASALLERLGEKQTRTLRDVQKSAAGVFLNKDPDKAISAVISGGNSVRQMRQLFNSVKGNAHALAGLRNAIMEDLKRKVSTTGEDMLNNKVLGPGQLDSYWQKNRATFAEVLDKKHMKLIDDVLADATRSESTNKIGRAAGSNTVQNLSTGSFISKVTGGWVDPANTTASLLMRPLTWIFKGSEGRIQEMLLEAILDPEMASTLMKKASPENMKKIAAHWQARFALTQGVSGGLMEPDER
jgi:hypothetical protein